MAFCYIKIVDYSEKVRSYAKSTYVSENTADTVLCTVAGVFQDFFLWYDYLNAVSTTVIGGKPRYSTEIMISL